MENDERNSLQRLYVPAAKALLKRLSNVWCWTAQNVVLFSVASKYSNGMNRNSRRVRSVHATQHGSHLCVRNHSAYAEQL